MNQTIINTYGIQFISKELDFPGWGKKIIKTFSSNEDSLTELFNGLSDEDILLESMLPEINQALSTPGSEFENGSETIDVKIFNNRVDLFKGDYQFVFTLPTTDFKEILIGWINFLQEPPTAQDLHRNAATK